LENQLRDVELVLQFGAEAGRTHNIPLPVADELLFL
jgi:hypothetical protein